MNDRIWYVTSDLHLGDGGSLDDFVDDAVFADWLGGCDAAASTVVLNGDVVDFAQIPPYEPAKGTPSHLLWREPVSMDKLTAAVDAHPVLFDALADYHRRGGRSVVTVGNHDLDMAWPTVQQFWRDRTDASGSVCTFVTDSIEFDGVHIQHGHQHTAENRTRHPDHFIHVGPDGHEYLERVWGTDFVITFFNDLHDELRFAQNIKPTWQLLVQGLKNGWLGWRHMVRAVAFVARAGLPLDMLPEVVLSGDDPDVDLSRLDDHLLDPATALVVRDAIRALGGDVTAGAAGLDSSLAAALASGATVDLVADEFAWDEPANVTLGLFRDDRIVRGARSLVGSGGRHVVLGHTHQIVDGHDLGDGRLLFNPGTWIPVITLDHPEVQRISNESGISKELLENQDFYDTDACIVEIPAGETPRLMHLT